MTSSQGPAGTTGAASGPKFSRQGVRVGEENVGARQASVFSELLKLHVPGQYGHGQAGTDLSSAVAWFRAVPSSDWLGQQQQGVSLLSVSAEWPEQQQQQAGAASVCRTGEARSETSGVALASRNAAKL